MDFARLGQLLTPPVLALEINDACVSRCVHCSYGQKRYGSLLEMQGIEEMLVAAQRHGATTLTLAGREPFLNARSAQRSIAVLSAARDAGFTRLAAITSASCLAQAIDALGDAGICLTSLDVSVDGLGKTHDLIRGRSEWRIIEQALGRLPAHSVADSLNASVTLQRGNVGEVISLLDWLAGEGRCDGALLAPVSMTEAAARQCRLPPGELTRLLDALECWHEQRRPATFSLVVELTPNASCDVFELARRGLFKAEKLACCGGLTVAHLSGGILLRLANGIFGYGRVLRIAANGDVRIHYAMPPSLAERFSWRADGAASLEQIMTSLSSGEALAMLLEWARRLPAEQWRLAGGWPNWMIDFPLK